MRRAALLLLTLLAGCGYRLQGTGGSLPPSTKVIAVLPFELRVAVAELDQRVTEAVTREMTQRARVKVQSTSDAADAVLRGTIAGYGIAPVSFDPATGRANRFRAIMDASVTLTGADGKLLYRNDAFHFEEYYEQESYGNAAQSRALQEETVAYDRIARDFARALVAAILEGEPAPKE